MIQGCAELFGCMQSLWSHNLFWFKMRIEYPGRLPLSTGNLFGILVRKPTERLAVLCAHLAAVEHACGRGDDVA
jgi:hypothetical protein